MECVVSNGVPAMGFVALCSDSALGLQFRAPEQGAPVGGFPPLTLRSVSAIVTAPPSGQIPAEGARPEDAAGPGATCGRGRGAAQGLRLHEAVLTRQETEDVMEKSRYNY